MTMKIGIVDADLIGRSKHRFPNLACMKLSGHFKRLGHDVELLISYDDIEDYDLVYISKVFTETPVPDRIINLSWVKFGGTGFYYDKAEPLPYEIEHGMPDYHLYDEFIDECIRNGVKEKDFTYYRDYSIGFTTRGCIRGCSFCVNKNYRMCSKHSPVSEFLDPTRKYIGLLDDNVLSCKDWKSIFDELNSTGKRFQFKQGMDERLLTDEKCEVLFNSNWIGDYIFAFDNIKDRRIVERKLQLIREHTHKIVRFYVFTGYNHNSPGEYNEDFWKQDIRELFERIVILMRYHALPYIMRYADYEQSPYRGIYITVARWCNQPAYFKKRSFREYCERCLQFGAKSPMRYLEEFERENPDIAGEYFDAKWG